MKISTIFLLLFKTFLFDSQSDSVKLYNLPGIDKPAEFSNEQTKLLIEEDIKKFQVLSPYKPTKLKDMDLFDKNLGTKITQQILKQGDNHGAKNFFTLPEELNDQSYILIKGNMKMTNPLTFESFYDYETDKYLHKYQSPQALASMKKIHEEYYDDEEKKQSQQSSFYQTLVKDSVKRPKELPHDFKSSFLGLKEKSKLFPLVQLWEYLDQKNCWASSRYEMAFGFILYFWLPVWKKWWFIPYLTFQRFSVKLSIILFSSYPCPTHTSGWFWWFWFSEKIPQEKQQITFRFEFDTVKRVRFMFVQYMICPREIQIETTQDNINWEIAKPWEKTPKYLEYLWYFQFTEFRPIVYAKAMKLVLKGFRQSFYGARHGIWSLQLFGQQQTVQLLQKSPTDNPLCLSRAENTFKQVKILIKNNQPYLLMNCYDSVLQNDSREIFQLENLLIKQWSDLLCLAPKSLSGDLTNQFIVSNRCKDSEEHQWIIDRMGKIENKKFKNQCLAAEKDSAVNEFQQYGHVTVSASIGDSRSHPYNPVQNDGYGWWAPPLDISHAFYQIVFEKIYFLEKLVIKWTTAPPKIEIQFLNDQKKWLTVLQEDPKSDVELKINPMQIQGIKILLLDLDITSSSSNNDMPNYGIKKLEAHRPGIAVSLKSCNVQGSDSKLINRFVLEEVEYVNIGFLIPYKVASNYLEDLFRSSIINIRLFIQKALGFEKVVQNGQKIRQLIENMLNQLNSMTQIIEKNAKNIKQNLDKKSDQESKSYASSQKNPATDCLKIKEWMPQKRSGFYWIKTKCMPNAYRVYCDFDNYNPNFYLYHGNDKNKKQEIKDANSIKGIQQICGSLGLEPIIIKNGAQLKQIIDFLNQSGANGEDNYVIPLAVRYNLLPVHRSIQSQNTDIVDQFFLPFIKENPLGLLTSYPDAIALKSLKTQLERITLQKSQVRGFFIILGVVCSQNTSGQSKLNNAKLKCSDTMKSKQISGSANITFICPKGCKTLTNLKVYGGTKETFGEESSICRAGLYMGILKDNEESQVTLRQFEIKDQFVPITGESNQIKSEKFFGKGGVNKSFKFENKPLEDECINLKKQSFISFDEILGKIQKSKLSKISQKSFIESDENLLALEQQRLLNKDQLENQLTSQIQIKEPEKNQSSVGNGFSSLQAINYVKDALKKRMQQKDILIKYIENSKKVVQDNFNKLLNIYKSDISPDSQKTQVINLKKTMNEVQLMIKSNMDISVAQLRKTEQNLKSTIDNFLQINKYKPFKEDYSIPFNEIYLSQDFTGATSKSKWKYTKENLQNHKQAISQVSTISCQDDMEKPQKQCTATTLTIKFWIVYDFDFQFDFKIIDLVGVIGMQFRQQVLKRKKDNFNYYALEISKDFIRIRRMMNGEHKIISKSSLKNSILSDKWQLYYKRYNLRLEVRQNIFIVRMNMEGEQGVNYQKLPQVLFGQDLYFLSGSFALLTDNAQGSYFDNIFLKPAQCFKEDFDQETAKKYKGITSRFHENYENDIFQSWDQKSEGKNQWIIKKNYMGKKGAICKTKLQNQKEPSLILKNKFFYTGSFLIKAFINSVESSFSIYLYHQNPQNTIQVVIKPTKMVILSFNKGEKTVLMKSNIKLKLNDWSSIYFDADKQYLNCFIQDSETQELIPCYEQNKVQLPLKLLGNNIGFLLLRQEICLDYIRLDPLRLEQFMKQLAALESKLNEGDMDDQKEDDNNDNNLLDVLDSDKDNESNKKKNQQTQKVTIQENFQNSNKIDYQICIDKKTQEDRNNYCDTNLYPENKQLQENCQKNFCQFCCQNKFPVTMKSKSQICEKECKKNFKPSSTKIFDSCFEPSDPQHSSGRYCSQEQETNVSEKPNTFEIKRCTKDFCQLCCITTHLQYKISVMKEDVKKCKDSCKSKFMF